MQKVPSHVSGPIAKKVARQIDRLLTQKVIDLSAVREGRDLAERRHQTAPGRAELDELHPAHAAYASTYNQVSILAEGLSQLDELDRVCDLVNRAQDDYSPSGPPMSPLTNTFFGGWAHFDCGVGVDRETFGTVLLSLRRQLRMHDVFADLLGKWQASYMGLYEVEEASGPTVRLRELVTDSRVEALNPTGHRGRVGSVWYVRALPPPAAGFDKHVIVTTPYEVEAPGARGWMEFLERTLPKTRIADRKRAYQHLMKWGLEPRYWCEYVFEAYKRHAANAIWLMGLPDVEESRPHSRRNEDDARPLYRWLEAERNRPLPVPLAVVPPADEQAKLAKATKAKGASSPGRRVKVPSRKLSETILDFGAPLLEALGPMPGKDAAQKALSVVIAIWNFHVMATPLWGKPHYLAEAREKMCGAEATHELSAPFEFLAVRWREGFVDDPRMVGDWSIELDGTGGHKLVCTALLPEGVTPATEATSQGGRGRAP